MPFVAKRRVEASLGRALCFSRQVLVFNFTACLTQGLAVLSARYIAFQHSVPGVKVNKVL